MRSGRVVAYECLICHCLCPSRDQLDAHYQEKHAADLAAEKLGVRVEA